MDHFQFVEIRYGIMKVRPSTKGCENSGANEQGYAGDEPERGSPTTAW